MFRGIDSDINCLEALDWRVVDSDEEDEYPVVVSSICSTFLSFSAFRRSASVGRFE